MMLAAVVKSGAVQFRQTELPFQSFAILFSGVAPMSRPSWHKLAQRMLRANRMEPAARRKTLRLISNGMYVMTSRCGSHYGAATVTWISQASFKPPLVMAAVRTGSNVFKCMVKSRLAAIHILGCDQKDFAQKFFFPTVEGDGRINGEPFVDGMTGVPLLQNAPAHIECRVVQILNDIGDHAIFVLEVLEAECRGPVRPLTIAESPWEYGG